ncbi:MAG: DUF1836 domain-containing protein [Clostridia bacterium]|nr:DUF1836 domain-containing protein [Clostridia bacterium]
MSPLICFPGTKVPVNSSSLLNGIFTVTNGLTLSQVSEMTGVEASSIQNWVKRGFVNPPVGRKYSKSQVARIILINMLRETFVIERATKLLSYVNGDLLDASDDIMDDSEIYQCLCDLLIPSDQTEVIDIKDLSTKIDEQLRHFIEPYPGAKDRLVLALKAIIFAYESASFKKLANDLTEGL